MFHNPLYAKYSISQINIWFKLKVANICKFDSTQMDYILSEDLSRIVIHDLSEMYASVIWKLDN